MPRPPIAPPHHDTGPVPQPTQRRAEKFIPHTTHRKAELYLVIAPQLEALADELMQLNLKTSGLAAEPQVVAQAARLLRDAKTLMRGEPGAHLVELDFTPPMRVQALALGLRQVSRAAAGFRDRYYGYNPLVDCLAWAVADAYGNPDPRWLGRPARGEKTLAEINVMTAELMRAKLIDLAYRNRTPLPADLQRPEVSLRGASEPKPNPKPKSEPPAPAYPPWAAINRRRTRRIIRSGAHRALRHRGEWPPSAPRP